MDQNSSTEVFDISPSPALPVFIDMSDVWEMRFCIADEGRAQNAVVALEAQLELRRSELKTASQIRIACGSRINDKYKLSGNDSYSQADGKIERALPDETDVRHREAIAFGKALRQRELDHANAPKPASDDAFNKFDR